MEKFQLSVDIIFGKRPAKEQELFGSSKTLYEQRLVQEIQEEFDSIEKQTEDFRLMRALKTKRNNRITYEDYSMEDHWARHNKEWHKDRSSWIKHQKTWRREMRQKGCSQKDVHKFLRGKGIDEERIREIMKN